MEGLGTGVDAYLTKPFNASVLQLQVSNLIDRQHRLREQLRQEPVALEPSSPPQSPFEARVREVIEQHLSDPQFSVAMLADAVALSRQQLYRRLRDDTGETPVAYIRQFRLERAARLLREQQGNVSEVAYAVGFNSLSYFTRCFHEHFEETPSAFLLREGH
jgi:AraC-like DNA-binding protein